MLTKRLSAFVVDHPWWVIALIVALTGLFGSRLSLLTVQTELEHFFLEGDPAIEFYHRYLDRFDTDEFFLLAIKTGDAFSDDSLALVRKLTDRLAQVNYVKQVMSLTNITDIVPDAEGLAVQKLVQSETLSPGQREELHRRALANPLIVGTVVSADGKTTALFGRTQRVENEPGYRHQLTADLKQVIAEMVPAQYEAHLAGAPVFQTTYDNYVSNDLLTFTPVTIVLLAVLMLLIYRRWRAVWLPMICILVSLTWTLGALQLAGKALNQVTNIIPPLLLVIGLAVIVHVINRYEEAYLLSGDKKQAIRLAVEHLVLPCFLTSLTTAIGFASLGVSRILPIRETGLLAAAGVMMTFAIAITFAPAILALLKPPKPQVATKRRRDFIARLLDACIRAVQTRPKTVLVVSAVFTAIALVGLPMLQVETNLIEYFKTDSDVRRSYNFLEKNVSGANAFEFFIEGEGPDSVIEPAVLRAIEATQRELETFPFVTVTQSLADLVKMMNRSMHGGDEAFYRIPDTRREIAQYLMLVSMGDDRGGLDEFTDINYSYTRISARMTTVGSKSLRGMVEHVKEFTANTFPTGIAAAPTGASVLYVDMERELVHGQLKSFSLAIVIIIFCVALLFGSARVGLYSIYPNVLPILMTLGLMGLVGIPINLATCMIPSIAIGIAVDDTIHFFSRFRREYNDRGRQNLPEALAHSLRTTGRAMYITSAVLFCGFMVLLVSNFVPNLYFGVFTALTMIWALAADLLTVPAMLNVLRPKKF